MERYTFLRQLADSWVLLALTLFFVGVILFVFRPGSRGLQRDAAESIFRNEKRPAAADSKEVK
ncbi:MAG: cbb3-type cytochrome c oxidase subunit 3 [Paracoccus sp. (in: a-proteobacteria)]|nr:cbb3-type cytochrome c oxidase subunit 3 [Paracoccus sp. (in: a-proteobacteria)]